MGFFPALVSAPASSDPALVVEHGHGRLLGLFPVNLVHNLVHLGLGLWAVGASKSFEASRLYCRATACIYGLLGVLGFVPGLNTLFGVVPIHGHDIWLHLGLAAVLAYFGFRDSRVSVRPA